MANEEGAIFCDQFTLDDTEPYQPYKNKVMVRACWIYTSTQNCYIGRQGSQPYLLAQTSSHSSTNALFLRIIDLSTLWLKAAVAGAVVTIIGTQTED